MPLGNIRLITPMQIKGRVHTKANLPHFHELSDVHTTNSHVLGEVSTYNRHTGGSQCIVQVFRHFGQMEIQILNEAPKQKTENDDSESQTYSIPSSNPYYKTQALVSLFPSAPKPFCLSLHPLKCVPQSTGQTVHFIQCAQVHAHHGLQHFGLQPLHCLGFHMVSF